MLLNKKRSNKTKFKQVNSRTYYRNANLHIEDYGAEGDCFFYSLAGVLN